MNKTTQTCSRCLKSMPIERRHKLCVPCRDYNREQATIKRQQARESGKCVRCHLPREPERINRLHCGPCFDLERVNRKALLAERKAENRCLLCKKLIQPGHYASGRPIAKCEKCRREHRQKYPHWQYPRKKE